MKKSTIVRLSSVLVASLAPVSLSAQAPPSVPSWVATSNTYTNKLVAIEMKHQPEAGSDQGLSQYDALASQPTLADEDQQRQEIGRAHV